MSDVVKDAISIGDSLFGKMINKEAWGNALGMLTSNESIIKNVQQDAIDKSQGIAGTLLRVMGNESEGVEKEVLGDAIKNAYTNNGKNINYGAIAGSYIGLSAGYRLLSGGGVYKDKNGNTNLIGIPFI